MFGSHKLIRVLTVRFKFNEAEVRKLNLYNGALMQNRELTQILTYHLCSFLSFFFLLFFGGFVCLFLLKPPCFNVFINYLRSEFAGQEIEIFFFFKSKYE